MRITIPTLGTRGDVGPYVALGTGLAQRGHDVTIATHAVFEPLVREHGLDFATLPGDPAAVFDSDAWRGLQLSRRHPRAHAGALFDALSPLLQETREEHLEAACAGADALLVTMTAPATHGLAQRLGLPAVVVPYLPLQRTGAFPQPVLAPGLRLGRLANRVTYPLAERVLRQPFQEPVGPGARRALGLAPVPLTGPAWWFPTVHGFSEAIVPRPADWPLSAQVAGHWFLPRSSALSDRTAAFLDAGPPPVFIGFGSMRPAAAGAAAAVVATAVRAAGVRAIVGGGLPVHEPGVLLADEPHDLLFERCAGVVHHGGAGTTATALRAGRPSFVVPHVFDQWFWGSRVHALGAGPAPVPAGRLTAEGLTAALRALADPRHAAAAERVAQRLRTEDGVRTGAALVEAALAGRASWVQPVSSAS